MRSGRRASEQQRSGFTLLEVLTVVVIIVILMAMVIPSYHYLRARADRGSCVGNLKSLYVAASSYVSDQGHWPQVSTKEFRSPAFAREWYAQFDRYQIAPVNWVCPAIQRSMGAPDLSAPDGARLDYIPTPFSYSSNPRRHPTHPWFSERGNMHGDGNLVIFASGQVKSLAEVVKTQTIAPE